MRIKPFATVMDLINAHLFDAQPAHRRILAAYDLAWSQVDRRPSADNEAQLIEQLVALQAPGLGDRDAAPLAPWLSAWRDGLDPNAAEARSLRE